VGSYSVRVEWPFFVASWAWGLEVLTSWVDRYLSDCYALAAGTRALYAYHLGAFTTSVGVVRVESVGGDVVRAYLAGLHRRDGKPYSPYYLDQVYRSLGTFFTWVVREGGLEVSPMVRVRRPRVPQRKSPRLSLEEVERLLEAIKRGGNAARDLAMICLAVDSGLRRGEIMGLRLDGVDLDRATVRVLGKGSKERDVPIGGVTVTALAAWLVLRPAVSVEQVFITSGGGPFTVNGIQTMMHRLKKRAGLPHLRWHLLRHTFANHFINGGGPLRMLQKILGHASVTTTARIYTDPELPELVEAHRRASPLAQIDHKRPGGER